MLDSFYFFSNIDNIEKMSDLSKIKKITKEIIKDLPLWESYQDKDPIDFFKRCQIKWFSKVLFF